MGWMPEHTSCRKPGSVSSAVFVPPPTVSAASRTRTDLPLRASSTAAARPFGPAPTITASYSSGTSKTGTEDGAPHDLAEVLPLTPAIDEHAVELDRRLDAKVLREGSERVDPVLVLGAVP